MRAYAQPAHKLAEQSILFWSLRCVHRKQALHGDPRDPMKRSIVKIAWSSDGIKLILNSEHQPIFDGT